MKSPVSISFVAVGAAQFAAKSLVRFKPGRTGEAPSWEGRDADITTHEVGTPIPTAHTGRGVMPCVR